MRKLFFIICYFIILSHHAFSQWEVQISPTFKNLYDVKFVNQQTGWIVGSEVFLKTSDGGDNWIKKDLPGYYLDDCYFIKDTIGWLVGNKTVGSSIHGLRLKTSDGGESWVVTDSSQAGYFESVYFIDENNGWIVGGQGSWPDTLGLILRTIDGGATWSRVDSGKVSTLRDVVFLDTLTGFSVGEYGYIYKSRDGGLSWQLITQVVFWDGVFEAPLRQIYFTCRDSGWVAGGIGGTRVIGKTVDGGETWQFDLETVSSTLRGLCFIDSKTGWAVGSWGMIFKTSDFGNNWIMQQQIQNNPVLESICMVSKNEGWIVGHDGLLLKFKESEVTNTESSFDAIPSDFKLFQNYPNPFNPTTTIKFNLPKPQIVTIKVYDSEGREIKTLVNQVVPAGENNIKFVAHGLPSGIYFYKLETIEFSKKNKFIIQKNP